MRLRAAANRITSPTLAAPRQPVQRSIGELGYDRLCRRANPSKLIASQNASIRKADRLNS